MSDDYSEEPRRRTSDSLFEQLELRFSRFEDKLDARLSKFEGKLESRAQWEKQIELKIVDVEANLNTKIAELQNAHAARLGSLEMARTIGVWVIALVVTLYITGSMALAWGLLTNRLEFVDHSAETHTVVVTATPLPSLPRINP